MLLNQKKLKYLSALLLLSSIVSCSPVKQVLKDKKKFDKVAEEVIRRGYCVNDTTVITEYRDSIVYKDSTVSVFKPVPCRDFDTTIGRARIVIRNGELTYRAKDSIVYRTMTVTNTVRDKSYENILKKDLQGKDTTISAREATIKELRMANKQLEKDLSASKWRFWLLVIAIAVVILFNIYLKYGSWRYSRW